MSEINNEPEKKETESENTVPPVPEETPEQKKELDNVDEMEKQTLQDLETLREANNTANDEAMDEAEEQLKEIFDGLRRWIRHNSDPEVVKARLEKGAADAQKVLNNTRETVIKVANSEQFKKTMEAGKDFVIGTGTMIGDTLKYGADQLMKNPTINKVVTDADKKLDVIRDNENVKEFVDKTQDAVDKLNTAIFNGIRSFFDHPDREPEKPAEANPENLPEPAADKDLPAEEEK